MKDFISLLFFLNIFLKFRAVRGWAVKVRKQNYMFFGLGLLIFRWASGVYILPFDHIFSPTTVDATGGANPLPAAGGCKGGQMPLRKCFNPFRCVFKSFLSRFSHFSFSLLFHFFPHTLSFHFFPNSHSPPATTIEFCKTYTPDGLFNLKGPVTN